MSTSELEPKIIRTQVSRITRLSSNSITSHKRPCAYEVIINTPEKLMQCASIQAIIYKSNPSIIMMIDNLIININVHMLMEILLWFGKPTKNVLSNNNKRKFNTQHLKLIRLGVYVKITAAYIHLIHE